ncbi:8-oxo-dGTP pyrophosphatase MutT (NUDIX family) [Sphingomonas vulcanisoli]|uniref:8-oxo-dGTP pyrophosphatase MutT (NUDIX family) n=1 Tax=Sphingomonas vulcanisoli TaxID=1658060 RepID=A0ABX0TUE1_9SPHN|nr:8-oxo-dGTP pyrophosphatase MutT (NUDIX family) [Sphingomonas vulcanisoli]
MATRLATALARSEGYGPHADDFDAGLPLIAAAVLVAITDRAEPGVILTLRQPHLRRHAGQIAFPGGRADPEDDDAIATALREADEEIGLSPRAVDIVGISDRYRTGTDFDIAPVIGVIAPDLPLVPHEGEVADVFEVPLSFLLEPANHRRESRAFEGREREYYALNWGERRIWGATAGIIVNLTTRLAAFA